MEVLCRKGDEAVAQVKNGGKCESLIPSCLFFLFLTAIWAIYTMLANNILAFRYVNILVIALLAVFLLLSTWFVIKNQAKKTTVVLLLSGLLISSGVLFASQQLLNLTSNVNGHSNYTEFEMAVYVKKDSDIKDIKEIKEVVTPKGNNNEANLTALLDNIKRPRVWKSP